MDTNVDGLADEFHLKMTMNVADGEEIHRAMLFLFFNVEVLDEAFCPSISPFCSLVFLNNGLSFFVRPLALSQHLTNCAHRANAPNNQLRDRVRMIMTGMTTVQGESFYPGSALNVHGDLRINAVEPLSSTNSRTVRSATDRTAMLHGS